MARVPAAAFGDGTEIVRVYLASALEEAGRVEAALDAAGCDYAAEVEELAQPTALWPSAPRRGVGFWVDAAEVDGCADALERAGLVRGLVLR